MALQSPGVEVQVIDESFYTPGAPGTVPMIFVASAENKSNGSGTGTAPGTLQQNAGIPYLLTSQRELSELFGDPTFYTDTNNNPIHGSEINEYGLQAAYSLLGVSNRAYVVRADLDLGKLTPQADAPAGNPESGSHWLDVATSAFGVKQWNGAEATNGGQQFTNVDPIVITNSSQTSGTVPLSSIGTKGDYALVALADLTDTGSNDEIYVYYKNRSGAWVQVGSSAWKASWATITATSAPVSIPNTTLVIDTIEVPLDGFTTIDQVVSAINDEPALAGITAAVVNNALEIYSTGASGDSITINELDENNDPVSSEGLLQEIGIALGTYAVPKLQISGHTDVPEFRNKDTEESRPTGSVWINVTEPNSGTRLRVKRFNAETLAFNEIPAPFYADNVSALYNLDRAGGGNNIPVGDLYVNFNSENSDPVLAEFEIYRREKSGATEVTTSAIADQLSGTYTFTIAETVPNDPNLYQRTEIEVVTAGGPADAQTIVDAINSEESLEYVVASVESQNKVALRHVNGGEIYILDDAGLFAALGFVAGTTANLYESYDDTYSFVASNWAPLVFTASEDAITSGTADGELWYSSVVDEADIMIHDGTTWVGYQNFDFGSGTGLTDPNGPIVSATEPTTQSDSATALADGDIWISTADLDNYPLIYVFNADTQNFELRDSTDQSTGNGIIFADARYGSSGSTGNTEATIATLLTSDFLDPDAPDPALYPKGMLLFNTRRSGFNVKRYVKNYIDVTADNPRQDDESMALYEADRWVTESANQEDGSGSFGRKAQRKVVVQALQAMVNSNQAIRDDETRLFNIMATPGYPELIGEMISLNFDRNLSAFVIGDTPPRLTPDATTLNEWGTNVRNAVEDNINGLVSRDEYLGVYYPWGFTSDNAGNNVVVPPSHMMLRTMALNDQVAFPWFAPAGTRRGGITNASATGFINDEGEFSSIALNEGQRDTLYNINVNPITFLSGSGLVAFGQKTRARNASALDRINVARLVIFLRGQLKRLAKPYLFEPNDKITRDQIKAAAESICLELVGLRALNDFLVVCDETNNTPARIDRNELYLDIAIEPVKAVEFIYIPLRLKNTGEIAGL